VLFVLCYRVKNPTMYALAEDHRNDVASNIVALTCGLIGIIHFHLIRSPNNEMRSHACFHKFNHSFII
jgi:hypothetical protein